MPATSKRPRSSRQAQRNEKKLKLKEKQKTPEDVESDEPDDEEDEDAGDSSEATDDGDGDAGPQELEWFSLEGCEPEPGDSAAVARLLRRCQLPPWAPAGAAAALAERLTNTPEGRRFASVVKQGLPDDEEEEAGEHDAEDAESGVFSVLGLAELEAAAGLRECLGDAAPQSPLQLRLLVKARAQELPPELALPQLEALQAELAKTKPAPARLLLISPTCRVGESDSAEAEEAIFAEDDILQAAAGIGEWKQLRRPAAVGGEPDADAWSYRVGLLDARRLPAAIERLKQSVGGSLRPA